MKIITNKSIIMDALQWSSEEYEQRLFTAYWNYCQLYGQYPSINQQLLANSALNKWFLFEYKKLEDKFIKLLVAINPNDLNALEAHYKASTADISLMYPKPLLDEAKRNRDFSNEFIPKIIYISN